MFRTIKNLCLALGVIFLATGVYMFVMMDMTVVGEGSIMQDGLGFAMVGMDAVGRMEQIFFQLGAWLPWSQPLTHQITLTYVLIRILIVFLLVIGLSFLFYGIFGPRSEQEMEEAIAEDAEE